MKRTASRVKKYYRWLISKVCDASHPHRAYSRLFERLWKTEFYYSIFLDKNREKDGTYLRYRYGCETGDRELEDLLSDRPCGVLEMMVGLVQRCEEGIMSYPGVDDGMPSWFWNMIESLGLSDYDDERYDDRQAEIILSRFLNREYQPNGKGGLYFLPEAREDLRKLEIWKQMHLYLNKLIKDENMT